MLATYLQVNMLDCNAVAGRQRKCIVGLCVITEIGGRLMFTSERERERKEEV
jgi:hypothetical protein